MKSLFSNTPKSVFKFTVLSLLLLTNHVHADWMDLLKDVFESAAKSDSGKTLINQGLSNEEVIQGLKAALDQGVKTSVEYLGRENGFWGNEQFKIPLPENLRTVEKTLRTFGQGEMADEFVLSLNRAAEQAVPQAIDIFLNTIKQMKFDDARNILNGSNTAATEYLQRTSSKALAEKFLPIVSTATAKTGVTARYKTLLDQLDVLSGVVDMQSFDIDNYVTNKAVEALFRKIAEEEVLIRQDPIKRTTDLLRKVFGSV